MSQPILDTLNVWWGDRLAGALSIDKGGAMHFAYAADWLAYPAAPPLSQALPKQTEPFGDHLCKAVFGGLLPEEGQRTAIARALGVSPDNPFRLLQAIGGDVAGALAFLPEDEKPPRDSSGTAPEPLQDDELAALLDRLPRVSDMRSDVPSPMSLRRPFTVARSTQ